MAHGTMCVARSHGDLVGPRLKSCGFRRSVLKCRDLAEGCRRIANGFS